MKSAAHSYKKLNFNSLFIFLLWSILWSSWFSVSEVCSQQTEKEKKEADDPVEYTVEEGSIYHFAKFAEWTPETFKDNGLMNFCVATEVPDTVFSNISSTLKEKRVEGKKIVIKRCQHKDDVKDCHILLFLASKDIDFINEKSVNSKRLNIMTVGEKKKFAWMGGVIDFLTEEKKNSSDSQAHAQPVGTEKKEDRDPNEYKVKAGFIYNFAKFTEWIPETFKDSSLMNLCVAADESDAKDPDVVFSDMASTLNEKSVEGKKIIVKKCENKDETKNCHILFVASAKPEFIQERLDSAKGLNILTVGEAENFARMGGMINFLKENKGINIVSQKALLRFEVNEAAAGRAKLKFRSQLLMSAKIFREEVK